MARNPEKTIREAIEAINDPATEANLVSLGMVKNVAVQNFIANVNICLPTKKEEYPYIKALESRISEALEKTSLVKKTFFSYDQMNYDQLKDYTLALEEKGFENFIDSGKRSFLLPATRIITIASGKGGVGKSSISANLALALSKYKSVGLLDADIYGCSIPKLFNKLPSPIAAGDIIIPPKIDNLRVISVGHFIEEESPVLWRGPMLHKALEQLIQNVYWGYPDLLIIDMPPGTGDVTLSLTQLLSNLEFYIVTTPQAAAARVAKKSYFAAKSMKLTVRGIIENMSYFEDETSKKHYIFGKDGGKLLAKETGKELLAKLPFVPEFLLSADSGTPIVLSNPESKISKAFDELAQKILTLGPTKRYPKELKIRT